MDQERAELFEDTVYARCRRCDGRLHSLEFDGEHEDCRPRVDPERQRAAIHSLYLRTARMLKREGHADEAARLMAGLEGR
jgi:hypothetical protein